MNQHVKIAFSIEQDSDGYPPVTTETLWAKDLGADEYEIDSIPFFARSIALGDVVTAKSVNEELQYEETIRFSGHSTLRVVAHDMKSIDSCRKALKQLGCSTEMSHLENLFSVDVPAAVDLDAVRAALDLGESSGIWSYEEACIGH